VSGSGNSWAICKSAPRSSLQYPNTQFFTGRMPFLPPNQQRQSTEGKSTEGSKSHLSSIRLTSIFQSFYRVVLCIMDLCPSVSVRVHVCHKAEFY